MIVCVLPYLACLGQVKCTVDVVTTRNCLTSTAKLMKSGLCFCFPVTNLSLSLVQVECRVTWRRNVAMVHQDAATAKASTLFERQECFNIWKNFR